jgi:hypothetical protein
MILEWEVYLAFDWPPSRLLLVSIFLRKLSIYSSKNKSFYIILKLFRTKLKLKLSSQKLPVIDQTLA